MARNRQYSSADNTITWLGTNLVGLAPDSSISVEWNEAVTEVEVGADANAVISKLPNRSGTITVTFQQESEGDRQLSAAYEAQESGEEAFPDGLYVFLGPLIFKSSTGEVITGINAHIQSVDARAWSSTANGSTRAWTFWCERIRLMSSENWAQTGMVLQDEIRQIANAIGG